MFNPTRNTVNRFGQRSVSALEPVVYIPNLNGGERLLRAVTSLRAESLARVVVVDNGSTDGSAEAAAEGRQEVRVLSLPENIGFGPALNRGVAEHPGDPIIFLNNDVVCQPDFLESLLAARGAGAEMVAGVLVQDDRPDLVDSAGVVAEADTLMAFDYLHGRPTTELSGSPAPLGPTGGAALYSREAFLAVGGFDERIFLYYEDLDLCLRLRTAGYECALAPGALARHAYSATLGSASAGKYRRTGWSRGYLLRRYGVTSTPGRALRAVACEGIVCAGQLLRDRTTAGVRGRLAGFRDAKGLPTLELPLGRLQHLSIRERLARRANRRR
jgi:GT2 family glycosyltransferase